MGDQEAIVVNGTTNKNEKKGDTTTPRDSNPNFLRRDLTRCFSPFSFFAPSTPRRAEFSMVPTRRSGGTCCRAAEQPRASSGLSENAKMKIWGRIHPPPCCDSGSVMVFASEAKSETKSLIYHKSHFVTKKSKHQKKIKTIIVGQKRRAPLEDITSI